ncbi:MAG: PDZ domain-containing protein [Deltaproteobacteria bacterium]|nr:PDZ domain-containing protein [Deltaproteobacteria bacterium]
MKLYLVIFLFLALFPWLAACSGRQLSEPVFSGSPYVDPATMRKDEIIDLPTGVRLSRDQLFHLLSCDRIVYVGEGHDNIYDHQVELTVIKELHKRFPDRIAVGFEMLARTNQEKIDLWLAGKISDDDFIRLFAEDWGVYDYIYYRDIFTYLKAEAIPVRGLNVSRREKAEFMQAMMKKPAKPGGADRKLPQIPEIPADPYQEKALRAMFAGHAEGHGSIDLFLKVHQLWEETMAETIVSYLTSPAGKDKLMIVISGEFHVARGYGLPRRVFQRYQEPYSILLTTTPEALYENEPRRMEVDFPELPLYLGDYLWCVPYRNLKDRQVRLGVGLKPVASGSGVEIVMVEKESAAARAGLEVGDRIVSFAGRVPKDALDISLVLLKKQKGDKVTVEIERAGKRREIEIVL